MKNCHTNQFQKLKKGKIQVKSKEDGLAGVEYEAV